MVKYVLGRYGYRVDVGGNSGQTNVPMTNTTVVTLERARNSTEANFSLQPGLKLFTSCPFQV
jgi:hypothetical protein